MWCTVWILTKVVYRCHTYICVNFCLLLHFLVIDVNCEASGWLSIALVLHIICSIRITNINKLVDIMACCCSVRWWWELTSDDKIKLRVLLENENEWMTPVLAFCATNYFWSLCFIVHQLVFFSAFLWLLLLQLLQNCSDCRRQLPFAVFVSHGLVSN